jgi:hypothetical protein
MAGDDCWSAGVLAGFDIGVLSSAVVLAGRDGERLTATMKNTGANTRGDGLAAVAGSALADPSEGYDRRDNRDDAKQTSERRRGRDNCESCTEDSDDECHRTQAVAWWWLVRGAHQGGPSSCCCSLVDDAVTRVTAIARSASGVSLCREAVPLDVTDTVHTVVIS